MCLRLDTGNSNLGQIDAAVDVIRAEGNEKHHHPPNQPRIIETLQADGRFYQRVNFSVTEIREHQLLI
jgi:hypothetical protein